MTEDLKRLAAFTSDPSGGNPAGVWIGDKLPEPEEMQRIAKDVGYSETAFVAPSSGLDRVIKYYSPEAEVPFCGHATIATGVALGESQGEGTYQLATPVGLVPLKVSRSEEGFLASLTSVEPKQEAISDELFLELLSILNWSREEIDESIRPMKAFAGVWHCVLAASSKERLDDLDYDFEALKTLMLREELTTVQLIWREEELVFHSRNPFPVGGVVEDPATGAAAAALGGYLRDAELVSAPCTVLIRQGEAMGRPSRIILDIPQEGGIIVSGSAVEI